MAAPFKRLKQESDADRVGPAGKLPPIVLKEVYEQRFSREDEVAKEAIWREVGRYLQRFVEPGARVVDIACDIGYFIRNIRAADRWAKATRRGHTNVRSDYELLER